jgi:hypothetical protein
MLQTGCAAPALEGLAAGEGTAATATGATTDAPVSADAGAAAVATAAGAVRTSEAAFATAEPPLVGSGIAAAEVGAPFGSRCAVIVKWSCPQAAPPDKSSTIGIMYAIKAQTS